MSVLQSRRRAPFHLLSAVVAASLALASFAALPAAAASTTGRIAGVVRDADGLPQADARVVLVEPSGTTAGTDTTDADGRYTIDAVAGGRYDLAVVTVARPVQRIARVRGVDVGIETQLDVVVLPPYATLSGVVRDRTGKPLAGATLNMAGTWARSDAQGGYSLQARPGTYRLSVSVGGNDTPWSVAAAVDGFNLTGDRVQDLTLAVTPLTIDGRGPGDEPLTLAGAHVYSPPECGAECPAGFELFPGSGEARGSWRACCQSATVFVLPGDLIVTATPADPRYAQVLSQPVAAPWRSPLPILMPEAPPPVVQPASFIWKGVVRHNGAPVRGAELSVASEKWGGYSEDKTDSQGRFDVRITPGKQSLSLYAPIGATTTDEHGGETLGLYLDAKDFEVTTGRTMDINVTTEDFAVTVLDADGDPAPIGASGASYTRSLEIFPGGVATATVQNSQRTDAAGKATFLTFPDALPTQIAAGYDGNYGWADVPAGARSATVRLTYTPEVTLSGTVRDARGPLALVNQPNVSFYGQASEGDLFDGTFIDPAGGYAISALAGHHDVIMSDLPEHDDQATYDHVATSTLPEVWSITTQIDLPQSRTLDLLIPDAGPAEFRTVDRDGNPLVAHIEMSSSHHVTLGSGLTGTASAQTHEHKAVGPVRHMMFGPAQVNGVVVAGMDTNHERRYPLSLPAAPGDHLVLAMSSNYTENPGANTAADPTRSGYWALDSSGTVYAFGDATPHGNAAAGAVDLEPTPSGKGYWTLNQDGQVRAFGDAAKMGDVDLRKLAKGETPASLSATPSGHGYWVFTNRGRAIALGDAPHLGDMSGTNLNGPVLGSVATPSGKGYYMVASDGGIFAFGDAAFAGSMGGKALNAPVQSLVPDADRKGYWLVAADGGIFAFDAPFHGSMGAKPLNRPVVGMVRYGDGYLMVGADGGIFNFSTSPFAGSLGDKPAASPVVAVAALP